MNEKTFSTANLAMVISGFILLLKCACFSVVAIVKVAPVMMVFGIIIFGGFFVVLYIKFPLYVGVKKEIEKRNAETFTKNLNWISRIYYVIFTAEPSKFVSFFSPSELIFSKKDGTFEWKNKPAKFIYKILDLVLMIVLSIGTFFLSDILAAWNDKTNINIFILMFIIVTLYLFKNIILSYTLSVKVDKTYGCNLNIIYPYSTVRFKRFNQFGQAIPLFKTISITQDVYLKNEDLKDYIIAHEAGHIHDKIRTFLIIISSILSMAFLAFVPFWLSNKGLEFLMFLPFMLYVFYSLTSGYTIKEKSELFADKYAVSHIGKEKCLEALNIMKTKETTKPSIFWGLLSIEKRISFVKNYDEKEN
jgi:hypothetical protein